MSVASPRPGVAWMNAPDWIAAAGPLFEAGRVEALEWSFDAEPERAPLDGVPELLTHFAAAGALLGHGVSYDVLGAADEERHAAWLRGLEEVRARLPLRWVTEHLGFVGGGRYRFSSPLPVPITDAALRVGRRRLRELARAFEGPIGLENLALALSASDVLGEGAFLRELLEEVDGFVLLDLHNLWCRAHNFGIPAAELLETYPLEAVREVHVSGGSWRPSSAEAGARVRRDTHDDGVPDEVFALLEHALPRCLALEFVILERLGGTLTDAAAVEGFRRDYGRVERLLEGAAGAR